MAGRPGRIPPPHTLPHDIDDRPLCAAGDPDMFFPDRRDPQGINKAIAVCRRCPILDSCLRYALTYNVDGVWGGTSEQQRRRMRRERNIHARPVTIVNLQLKDTG